MCIALNAGLNCLMALNSALIVANHKLEMRHNP
jgi:hypothetical protein